MRFAHFVAQKPAPFRSLLNLAFGSSGRPMLWNAPQSIKLGPGAIEVLRVWSGKS